MKYLMCALILVMGFSVGCDKDGDGDGGGAGTAISCSWFEADNCWRQTVVEASTCLWGTGTQGTLAGNRASCTEGSNTVTFNTVIAPAPLDTEPWSFTMNNGSSDCLTFLETDDGQTVTTSLGEFRTYQSAGSQVMACPNGDVYSISINDVFGCDFSKLPGYAVAAGVGFSFSLIGNPDQAAGFSCQ